MYSLLLALLFFVGASASEEAVVKYDTPTFNKLVPQKNHYILFYAPWISELKSLSPIWEELAQKYKHNPQLDVVIAKVDCTVEAKLCSHQDASEYPTFKFYKTGGSEMGARYRGPLDLKSLEQFANFNVDRGAEFVYGARVSTLPERQKGLLPLQDENFFDVVTQAPNAVVNFCTPWSSRCMDLEPIWKQIAEEFQYETDLLVAVVDCTMSKTTCNENEVRGYPSILWLVDGIVAEKYPSKDRTLEPLKKYILGKLGRKEPTKLSSPKQLVDPMDDPDSGSSAIALDEDTFYDVIASENITFVHFWTAWCSDCMTLETNWEALAEYFHDHDAPVTVKIAKVDCVIQKPLCEELQVDEFPSVIAYRNGELQHIYAGGKKLDDLIDFVTLAAKTKKPVEEL